MLTADVDADEDDSSSCTTAISSRSSSSSSSGSDSSGDVVECTNRFFHQRVHQPKLIKPVKEGIEVPSPLSTNKQPLGLSWPSTSWQDGSHRSAFQPYRPVGMGKTPVATVAVGAAATVLTNLQRGNTEARPKTEPEDCGREMTWHEKAGRGDLAARDISHYLRLRRPGSPPHRLEMEIDRADGNGLTALMWAASYGQVATVNALLRSGAAVDRQAAGSGKGETALILAAAHGHIDCVRLLLDRGAQADRRDKTGSTALMYAAYGDHAHCVNELLLWGADVTVRNNNRDTAYTLVTRMDNRLATQVIQNHILGMLVGDTGSSSNNRQQLQPKAT